MQNTRSDSPIKYFTYAKKAKLQPWKLEDLNLSPLRSRAINGVSYTTQPGRPDFILYKNKNTFNVNYLSFNNMNKYAFLF